MMMESPLRHSTSLNGPMQSTWSRAPASPTFSAKALETISWNGSMAGRIAHGSDSLRRTVLAVDQFGFLQRPEQALARAGLAAHRIRLGEPVEGELDVLGGQRRAVVGLQIRRGS